MERLRIIFFGTPEFAVPSLRALLNGGEEIVAVICQPDKPAGRGQKLVAPPLKQLAAARGVPVLQPEKLRAPQTLEALRALAADLIVVAAYGKILPPAVLSLPRFGCINVHASLLPKYRGAAPIQWALLRGETVTGITIMQMDEGMDTGDILLQRETPIAPNETYGELQTRLAELGAEALLAAIVQLKAGTLRRQPQDNVAATMAPMVKKDDGRLDWTRTAPELARAVRAYNPWPSAYTTLAGELLKIHRAHAVAAIAGPPGTLAGGGALVVACGSGALRLDELQLAGRKRLAAADFVRGLHLAPGTRLGAA
ncbi:MAG: methionyl-tRNA formyltransferase [Deltaproteobacteria bacterium]|nr:methionyl-tRNA formyltransferase [Deltaproteobacteria bacterium]